MQGADDHEGVDENCVARLAGLAGERGREGGGMGY